MNGDNPTQSDDIETDAERRMAEYVQPVDSYTPPSAEVQRTKVAALFAPAVRELMREARERKGR